MKKQLYLYALAAASSAAFAACSNDGNGNDITPEYAPGTISLSAAQQQMCENANTFAWKMMSAESTAAAGGSLAVSPLSMIFCLGMANAGAAGTTSGEITSALGFDGGTPDINQYCRAMLDGMPELDPRTTMSIANCVEVNKPYKLLSVYEKSVTDSYGALVESRDFTDPAFKSHINEWASDRTGGMITQLIDDVKADAIAYIVNAVYFKGKWRERFDNSLTKEMTFTTSAGDTRQTDMMCQTENFKYYEDDVLQAVSMDYGNGSYSMQVLLPQQGRPVSDIIETMRNISWKNFVGSMCTYEVAVRLPRFTIEYGGDMSNTLQTLGIRQMFTSEADFSNFCEVSAMVSKVVQKAKIEVDEDGTTAAAATYGEMAATTAGPSETKRFYADRPFIFVITEHSTGAICFIGQYTGK